MDREERMRQQWLRVGLLVLGAVLVLVVGVLLWEQQRSNEVEVDETVAIQEPIADRVTRVPSLTPTPEFESLPDRKVLLGGRHVFQTFNNCGPASLSMGLSYYGFDVGQVALGQGLRPYQHPQGDNDDKSVTLAELGKKAEEYGLRAYHRPAGTIEIMQRMIALDLPVLTRTWLEEGDDIGHYRVVKGYDDVAGVLVQDDSLQGKDLTYTYEAYERLWQAFNYEFLVLVPEGKVEKVERALGELLDEERAWQLALKLADEELEMNPNDLYAGFNRSVALFHLGRFEKSVEEFERIEDELPGRMLWYQIEPILAYVALGNDDRVMEISNDILANNNRAFSELYYLQGEIYERQGALVAAEEARDNAELYNSTGFWRVNVE